MHDDEKYMRIAIEEAQKASDCGEIPIGAVHVLDGEIIARAHNMRETWQDATAHSRNKLLSAPPAKSLGAGGSSACACST
jgi:tRNA(Arg) A34 adenosine deaminase TadA